jgi:predicted phage terminase large subunit-like protein
VKLLKQTQSTAPQLAFFRSEARFRAFIGGRGSGKTRAGVIEVLRQPANSTGMIIAPTNAMLRDGARKMLLDIARKAKILVQENISTGTIRLHGNRIILLRSAENPERLRGANLGWLWVDEAALVNIDTWTIAIATLREEPGRAWVTTTPRGRDWIYNLWTSGDPDYQIIHSRTADNHFLPATFIETLRKSYTEEQFRQEVAGEFVDMGGTLFKRPWFQIVDRAPDGLAWFRYWDTATSIKETADYTASVKCAFDENGVLYIADGIRVKAEFPDVRKIMLNTMRNEQYDTMQGIEQAQAGLGALQDLRRMPELANVSLQGYVVTKDKLQRAMPWAVRAEQGMVRVVRGEWVNQFIDECLAFPYGDHDDMVDAVSGAVEMLANGQVLYDFI